MRTSTTLFCLLASGALVHGKGDMVDSSFGDTLGAAAASTGSSALLGGLSGGPAGDFFLGGDIKESSFYTYAGVNYDFDGDRNSSGFIAQAIFGYGEYDYSTILGSVDATLTDYEASIGYEWFIAGYRLSVLGGVHHTNHDLSGNPIDLANNGVNGEETGFKAKVGIWNAGESNYIYGADFSYSTAYDSYWHRAMIARDLGLFHIGPEVVFLGNESYKQLRYGLTVGGLELGPATLGASIGYSHGDPEFGSSDQEELYGGVHVSFSF